MQYFERMYGLCEQQPSISNAVLEMEMVQQNAILVFQEALCGG